MTSTAAVELTPCRLLRLEDACAAFEPLEDLDDREDRDDRDDRDDRAETEVDDTNGDDDGDDDGDCDASAAALTFGFE